MRSWTKCCTPQHRFGQRRRSVGGRQRPPSWRGCPEELWPLRWQEVLRPPEHSSHAPCFPPSRRLFPESLCSPAQALWRSGRCRSGWTEEACVVHCSSSSSPFSILIYSPCFRKIWAHVLMLEDEEHLASDMHHLLRYKSSLQYKSHSRMARLGWVSSTHKTYM